MDQLNPTPPEFLAKFRSASSFMEFLIEKGVPANRLLVKPWATPEGAVSQIGPSQNAVFLRMGSGEPIRLSYTSSADGKVLMSSLAPSALAEFELY